MLVFIDESGDAGFKIASSLSLVIALVIFDDYTQADRTRQVIKDVMRATGQKPEFKFSKCSNANKEEFFKAIRSCKFRIKYISVSKKIITSEYLRKYPIQFYNFALKSVISHSDLTNAKIRIDGNSKKDLSKALIAYLRANTMPGSIDKLRMVDSRSEELIQLADMVVGALARPWNSAGKKDASVWKTMIKNKIDVNKGEWLFN